MRNLGWCSVGNPRFDFYYGAKASNDARLSPDFAKHVCEKATRSNWLQRSPSWMEDSAQPYSLGMGQFVGDSLDESSLIKPTRSPRHSMSCCLYILDWNCGGSFIFPFPLQVQTLDIGSNDFNYGESVCGTTTPKRYRYRNFWRTSMFAIVQACFAHFECSRMHKNNVSKGKSYQQNLW